MVILFVCFAWGLVVVGLFGGGFLFVDLVLFGLFLTYSEKFPKCIRWCVSLSKLTCLHFFFNI